MAVLSVDAGALAVGELSCIAFVPVEVLNMCLLLLVCALCWRVRCLTLSIVVLTLLLFGFVYSRREEVVFDCLAAPARNDRWLKLCLQGSLLCVCWEEGLLVPRSSFVHDGLQRLVLRSGGVGVVEAVRLALHVGHGGSLAGALQRVQRRRDGLLGHAGLARSHRCVLLE